MKTKTRITLGPAFLVGAFFSAVASSSLADNSRSYSDWSPPTNLGAVVNTEFGDLSPMVSKDGRSLYFFSDRPGGFGGNDIWVSRRPNKHRPWGEPENLGPEVNTAYNENSPTLGPGEYSLYFASDRPGGLGELDLYVAYRFNRHNQFAWRNSTNLGIGINTETNEAGAAIFVDRKAHTVTLYFHSNRPGGIGLDDIYSSNFNWRKWRYDPAAIVTELSSPFLDRLPGIRRDGLEMYISSNRPGTVGLLDIWVSARSSTEMPWSTPTNMEAVINLNSPFVDGRAVLSANARTLYFHSTRPALGSFDLYESTRSRVRGHRDE